MKALVSAIALLSFVAAATVPAVAYADDTASTAPAKKSSKSKSTKASTAAPKAKKTSKKKKAA